MMRQKQLQLKRQRDLRARSCGAVAQSDAPDCAAVEVQKKAAGWNKFCNDLERPQKRKSKNADTEQPSPPAAANIATAGMETASSLDVPESADRPSSMTSAPVAAPVAAVATINDDLQVGDVENDSGIFPFDEVAPITSLKMCGSKESLTPNPDLRPSKQQQGWDLQMQGDMKQVEANDKNSNEGKRG